MQVAQIKYLRCELEEYRSLMACLDAGKSWQAQALRLRHQQAADALAEELWQLDGMIAAIEDPELRLIFELRYFRGYTWGQVVSVLPTKLSADGARMKHDRFLQKYYAIRKDGSMG